MADKPTEIEKALIGALEGQARLLRDRIAAAESGLFEQGPETFLRQRRQLAAVDEQLEGLKSAHRT